MNSIKHNIIQEILDSRYQLTPSGISGNEDYGALSSW